MIKKLILTLFILLPLFAQEQQAMRRPLFTGMNTRQHGTLIGLTECELLLNADLRQPGKLKKRYGYDLIGDDRGSKAFKGLARFDVSGGTNCILGVEGTNLTYWTGTGNWATSIKTDLTDDLYTLLLVGNNYCLVSNGTDNVHKVDSAFSVTDLGDTSADPPKGTVGVYFNSRFFIAKDSYLYFSDVVTAASDPVFDRTQNLFPINLGDNDEITAIVPYQEDQLIIFKEHSTWWLNISTNTTPLTNWFLQPIDTKIGCISKGGAVKAGEEIYYISHDGLRSLSKTEQDKLSSVVIPVSDPIYKDWVEDIRYNKRDVMRLEYFNNMIIWGVPLNENYIDYWFVYFIHRDPSLNGWAVWENMNTTEFVKWFDDGEEKLFFSEGDADGKVYQMFSGLDDNGTTVQFELKSRIENFNEQGMGANKKYATSLYLRCEPADDSTITVYGNADSQGFERLEEGANLSLSVDHPVLPTILPFTLSGIDTIRFKPGLTQFFHWYDFQLQIKQTGADMELSILDYMIVFSPDRYTEDL